MFTETRKIHLIEVVLKLSDEAILHKLEHVIERSRKTKTAKPSAHDLLGLWSKKDAQLIDKAIAHGCEQVNVDDWK